MSKKHIYFSLNSDQKWNAAIVCALVFTTLYPFILLVPVFLFLQFELSWPIIILGTLSAIWAYKYFEYFNAKPKNAKRMYSIYMLSSAYLAHACGFLLLTAFSSNAAFIMATAVTSFLFICYMLVKIVMTYTIVPFYK